MAEDAPNNDRPSEPPADKSPAAPTPIEAPAAVAAGAGEEEGGRIDPQLVGLALILWLLAVGIFALKWDRLRVDWYLGNIKETADLTGRLDESSMQALADMAKHDVAVLRMIGDEVVGPLANRDEFYRSAVLKTIERVPGTDALNLVSAAAIDYHGVVRANAYVALGVRAKRDPAERAQATAVLLQALQVPGELEPMSRAFAISVVGDLEIKEALWPVIRAVREARGMSGALDVDAAKVGEQRLREAGADAFWKLSGTTKEQLPFDAAADLAARDAQVRAWERWYVEKGNEIPKGERFEEAHPEPATPPGPPAPPVEQPSTPTPPGPTTPPGEGSQ